ncbi:MAG: elongation factor 4 [Candidatus Solincola sediminis]|uniref:Elongation factor 4 n=1 Tax=Candidatus Solincola sediminis TaxID=1797199 RepID=A0A1F2WGM9_9ACTN|nr:MAG: elongation factor 4 [Candidatus Solincola sediminis]OFW58266.1 MAG: elongation factor 4 [Candidatus Solincola sediminis]
MDRNNIRNFCIIAHIDHGKSTLADRFLEITHTVPSQKMANQYLDRMELERERGITIKAQAVRMHYSLGEGEEYRLNLIDTPGHVDFSYEVSRSLVACEGAILLVDASQGIEAQTVGNAYLALEGGLTIIPVVNKIDLPAADFEDTAMELADLLGVDSGDVLAVSAKTGEGVEDLLRAVVQEIPPPSGDPELPLRALVFDSTYDVYKGVIAFVRVKEGLVSQGMKALFMATGVKSEINEVGYFSPDMISCQDLEAGDVGYISTGIKDVSRIKVGDTITDQKRQAADLLPGYQEPKPMVFAGVYPIEADDFADLGDALDKLKLSDSALTYNRENSRALGFGFRCGFLGLLHMEIVQERLDREYGLQLVVTSPTVVYEVETRDAEVVFVRNPSDMPDAAALKEVREPYVQATILVPPDYMGNILELVKERRGVYQEMVYLSGRRVEIRCKLPLAEIVVDFYDQLKSRSRGYASLDYEHIGFLPGNLVKLDILINGEPVDAFSAIVDRNHAHDYGKKISQRLRQLIPRQLFDVPVQAAIGGRVVARETIKAKRKDVLSKCYGGDVTRKKKLLEKQKEGKRRMKMVGKVEIPQEAFISALRATREETPK